MHILWAKTAVLIPKVPSTTNIIIVVAVARARLTLSWCQFGLVAEKNFRGRKTRVFLRRKNAQMYVALTALKLHWESLTFIFR